MTTFCCSRLNANKMTYSCIPYSKLLTGRARQDVSVVLSDSTFEVAGRILNGLPQQLCSGPHDAGKDCTNMKL